MQQDYNISSINIPDILCIFFDDSSQSILCILCHGVSLVQYDYLKPCPENKQENSLRYLGFQLFGAKYFPLSNFLKFALFLRLYLTKLLEWEIQIAFHKCEETNFAYSERLTHLGQTYVNMLLVLANVRTFCLTVSIPLSSEALSCEKSQVKNSYKEMSVVKHMKTFVTKLTTNAYLDGHCSLLILNETRLKSNFNILQLKIAPTTFKYQ